MQVNNNNNGGTHQHQACSACKHQRKKCSDNCILAPYFPSNKTKEFQAVHKFFGVSNVTKLVKSAQEIDRKRMVESLIWEAFCRQRDPINGSLGEYRKVYSEYRKVFDELRALKDRQNQLLQMQNYEGFRSQKVPISDHNNNNGMNYHLHQNNGGVMDSGAIYNAYYLQDLESLRTDVAIPIQQYSSQNLRQVMNSISEQWEQQMEEGTRVSNHTV